MGFRFISLHSFWNSDHFCQVLGLRYSFRLYSSLISSYDHRYLIIDFFVSPSRILDQNGRSYTSDYPWTKLHVTVLYSYIYFSFCIMFISLRSWLVISNIYFISLFYDIFSSPKNLSSSFLGIVT